MKDYIIDLLWSVVIGQTILLTIIALTFITLHYFR